MARRNAATELVTQSAIFIDKNAKRALLTHLIRTRNWHQVLVFTRTKHGANRLAEQLAKDGIPALAIHGNKSQGARTRALSEFKDGSLQVLVATEIAARGLDIVELPFVVNYELPNVPEDYVHRIGRTGRAGAEGIAVSLVSDDEKSLLVDIERVLKRSVPRETVEGFDLQAALAEARARRPAEAASERPSGGRRDGQRGRAERPRGEARPASRSGQPPARATGPRPSGGQPSQPRAPRDAQPRAPRDAQPRALRDGRVPRGMRSRALCGMVSGSVVRHSPSQATARSPSARSMATARSPSARSTAIVCSPCARSTATGPGVPAGQPSAARLAVVDRSTVPPAAVETTAVPAVRRAPIAVPPLPAVPRRPVGQAARRPRLPAPPPRRRSPRASRPSTTSASATAA